AREAESFYSPEDRARGWILGKDRSGKQQRMPLLTVSLAVVVQLPGATINAEHLAELLAGLKRQAKSSPDRFAARVFAPENQRQGNTLGRSDLFGVTPSDRLEGGARRQAQGRPVFTPSFMAAY
ncbi:MAG: hypothetical protein WCL50_07355, partial [Spirochaetota bacterium]